LSEGYPVAENELEERLKDIGDLIDKIKDVIDLFQENPISTGSREDLEDCIGRLSPEEVRKCRVRKRSLAFSTSYGYSRFFGLSSSTVDVDIILFWSFDGCQLYDIYFTAKNSSTTSDWIVSPKVQVSTLQAKERGECPCCPKGGDCVLIKIEVEVEYEAAYFPNPSMTETLFQGTLCASDGRLRSTT
jgi:hypothetical protein